LQNATVFWLSGTPYLSAVKCLKGYLCYTDRQTDIHTTEPFMPELSAFEVELDPEILKGYNSPDADQLQMNKD
jgi:hypothetical protein